MKPRLTSLRRAARFALVAAALSIPALFLDSASASAGPNGAWLVDNSRELFIKNVSVVDDPVCTAPGGAWHFGTMLANIAGTNDPSSFASNWMDTLIQPQFVNGVTVFDQGKSAAMQAFKNDWLAASGGQNLNLDLAPFRLLAIVNRPDLLKVDDQGFHQYGEGRFIYGAFLIEDATQVMSFFVIFEFGIPASSCAEVVDWASRWHTLSTLAIDSPAYRVALRAITDEFARPDEASTRPNHSNLNQLRINEFEVGSEDLDWSLREWNLVSAGDPNAAPLTAVTTKQTPHRLYLRNATNRQILSEYLQQNRVAILAGTHVVPDIFHTSQWGNRSFQTGFASNDCHHAEPWGNQPCAAEGTRWWAPGFDGLPGMPVGNGEVRHKFALQTCQGCHQQETGAAFFMVSNRQVGQESALAGFLTGIKNVPDPITPGVTHSFNDLAFRAYVLNRMLGLNCAPSVGGPSPVDEMKAVQAQFGTRVH